MAAEPDPGQRPGQQKAEKMPIDRAEEPVADAGDQGQRHRVSDVGADNARRRQSRIEHDNAGQTKGAAPDRGYRYEGAEHSADKYGQSRGPPGCQFADPSSVKRQDILAENQYDGRSRKGTAQHLRYQALCGATMT